MRVAVVRSDIGKIYTSDVESRVQRDFSAEPSGQSRNLYRPTDAALLAFLNANAILSLVGSNNAATVNTTIANGTKLNIKSSAAAGYTTITVTSSATATKAQIAADLNLGFINAGLPFVATVLGTDAIQIDSIAPNAGPDAYMKLDTTNAALATILGLATTAINGLTLAAFKAAVYVDSETLLADTTGPFATDAGANVLRIRTSATAPYSVITVRSNAATTGLQLVADLNAGFVAAGLPLIASLSASPDFFVTINTIIPVAGPGSIIQLDSNASGSTLNNVIKGATAWTAGVVTGTTGVYVSDATFEALSTWTSMQTAQKTAFYLAIRDLICPRFVETGPVLLSFVYGIFSKMRSPSFRPGGLRSGRPSGIAAAFIMDDGSAAFTL